MQEITIPETMDKKQLAMERAGATRDKAYKAMVEGLQSVIMTVDKYGEEHTQPDTANRLRSAELITKAHGDWKDGVTINNNTANINMTVSAEEIKKLYEVVASVNTEVSQLRESGRQTGRVWIETNDKS